MHIQIDYRADDPYEKTIKKMLTQFPPHGSVRDRVENALTEKHAGNAHSPRHRIKNPATDKEQILTLFLHENTIQSHKNTASLNYM